MQVKKMHPLCYITIENGVIGHQSPEASSLLRTRSLPVSLAMASLGTVCLEKALILCDVYHCNTELPIFWELKYQTFAPFSWRKRKKKRRGRER
ncbi:hypothetical protein RchiOBHm_Chr7g0176811 [Rosa chinensis]|uniref:Uncharacterized protein n=1 Tax=Rosa chinensis TaxID=74649 RepID=A0A2P6P1E5_ROSCH|nr:hypothetical protein RchiOBHm_Chr7g0176811 [Rosa chinensis]